MILTLIIIFGDLEVYGTAFMVHNSGVDIKPNFMACYIIQLMHFVSL